MMVMHMFLVAAAVLAVTAMFSFGVAGAATGWVVPWGRGRVLQPRLWGCGSLMSGIGVGVFVFVGPWGRGPAHGVREAVAWGGWGLFMVGLVIQLLAQRPSRTR